LRILYALSDGEGVLYFLFSGEKRKVPKKKAVMPPNTSAVEGFENPLRAGAIGRGDGVLSFFGRKKKGTKEKSRDAAECFGGGMV